MSTADLKKKIYNLQKIVKAFIRASEPSVVRRVYNNLGKRVKLTNYFNNDELNAYSLQNRSNSVTSNMSVHNRASVPSKKKASLKKRSKKAKKTKRKSTKRKSV